MPLLMVVTGMILSTTRAVLKRLLLFSGYLKLSIH